MTALVQADAVRLPLRSGSVALVVSSPPYFGKRDYGSDASIGAEAQPVDYVRALWSVMDELWRVTTDSASAWINLGDKRGGGGGHNNTETRLGTAPTSGRFTSDVRRTSLSGLPWRFAMGLIAPDSYRAPFENPPGCWHDEPPGRCHACRPSFPQWIGKAEVIWLKTNAHPEPVKNRVQDSHEPWFHLTKSSRYTATVDRIREPVKDHRRYMTWNDRRARGDGKRLGSQRGTYGGGLAPHPLGRVPGSVRAVATEGLRVPEEFGAPMDHRRLVRAWCRGSRSVLWDWHHRDDGPSDGTDRCWCRPFSGLPATSAVARLRVWARRTCLGQSTSLFSRAPPVGCYHSRPAY